MRTANDRRLATQHTLASYQVLWLQSICMYITSNVYVHTYGGGRANLLDPGPGICLAGMDTVERHILLIYSLGWDTTRLSFSQLAFPNDRPLGALACCHFV